MKSTYSVYSSTSSSAPTMMRASTGPVYRAATVHGGFASGSRINISSSAFPLHNGMRFSKEIGSGSEGFTQVTVKNATFMGNAKFAMQNLNDRLASYIETVRNLEKENYKMELKITEALQNSGPDLRDCSKYQVVLEDLRKKVFDAITETARLVLNIDNARLTADDFRVKYESELAIRQSVEADIAGFRRAIDDTNLARMNLESQIEVLKEELIRIKKNHEQDVKEFRNQITKSAVHVDVDARKGQDLAQVMAEIRSKYEKMAQKNQEELKTWHKSQIIEVQSQVSQNTEALKCAQTEVNNLRRQIQTLEIDLESQKSLSVSMERTLGDTQMQYNMKIESHNNIILGLEAELTQLHSKIRLQKQDYEALLNTKMKLEMEIATYRQLLDGENFTLQDVQEQKITKTKVTTVTQTLIDGKVVSSSTETKEV